MAALADIAAELASCHLLLPVITTPDAKWASCPMLRLQEVVKSGL